MYHKHENKDYREVFILIGSYAKLVINHRNASFDILIIWIQLQSLGIVLKGKVKVILAEETIWKEKQWSYISMLITVELLAC